MEVVSEGDVVSPPGTSTSTPVVEFIKAVLISVLNASGVLLVLVFSGVGDESKSTIHINPMYL